MPSSTEIREDGPQKESRESATNSLKTEAKVGFDQLDRGESVEMDLEAFMNHFRARRLAI